MVRAVGELLAAFCRDLGNKGSGVEEWIEVPLVQYRLNIGSSRSGKFRTTDYSSVKCHLWNKFFNNFFDTYMNLIQAPGSFRHAKRQISQNGTLTSPIIFTWPWAVFLGGHKQLLGCLLCKRWLLTAPFNFQVFHLKISMGWRITHCKPFWFWNWDWPTKEFEVRKSSRLFVFSIKSFAGDVLFLPLHSSRINAGQGPTRP